MLFEHSACSNNSKVYFFGTKTLRKKAKKQKKASSR